ncbi:hypothetical protein MKW94_002681, partial [Papaver nudicaule]|nr:hypothetical protein [Papaver nudicaule]
MNSNNKLDRCNRNGNCTDDVDFNVFQGTRLALDDEKTKLDVKIVGSKLQRMWIVRSKLALMPWESTGATKTLVVRNLSFSAAKSDV